MNDLLQYARKVEGDMYEAAKDKVEGLLHFTVYFLDIALTSSTYYFVCGFLI